MSSGYGIADDTGIAVTSWAAVTTLLGAGKALLPHVRSDIRGLDTGADTRDARCGVTVITRRTRVDGKSICVLGDSGKLIEKSEWSSPTPPSRTGTNSVSVAGWPE